MADHDRDSTPASAADLAHEDDAVEEIVGAGRRARSPSPGVATFIVVAIFFVFYFFVFLPRGDDPVTPIDADAAHASEAVAVEAERRWAIVVMLIIAMLLATMVFTGLHWASMPPSRVETIDPRNASHLGRVRREQPRHRRWMRTARSWFA